MITSYKFKKFEIQALHGFIWDLIHRFQVGQIRFSPHQGISLFNERQLTHIGPNFDLNNANDFLYIWSRNQEIVRVVTFEQFHKNKSLKIKMTFNLDQKSIVLESIEGIGEEDIETSLKKFFVLKKITKVPSLKRWWETTSVQFFMLFGSIASIIALFLIFYPPVSGKPMNEQVNLSNEAVTPLNGAYIKGYPLADLSSGNIQDLLNKIRNEHGVRQLLPLESGKKLSDVPPSTYMFLFKSYLSVQSYEDYTDILKGTTNRFGKTNGYFEVHKVADGQVYLLGFVSEETYININAGAMADLTLFSMPDTDRKFLLIIPVNNIKQSESREISFDERESAYVLDIKLNTSNRNSIVSPTSTVELSETRDTFLSNTDWSNTWLGKNFSAIAVAVISGFIVALFVYVFRWNK